MSENMLNFLKEFVDDLIVESELSVPDDSREALRNSMVERVEARLFLELIGTLTEEQSARVRGVLNEDSTEDMSSTFSSLVKEIPNAQGQVLASLMEMREELLKDLMEAGQTSQSN